MEVVKVTKNGVTKTVEKGALSIYQMRGWVLARDAEKKTTKTATKSTPYGTSF